MKKNRKIEINASEFGGLGEVLSHILGDILGDLGEKKGKIPLGIVSKDLKEKYNAWRDAKDEFEHEIKFQKEKIERKVVKELATMFEERFNESQKEKEQLWTEIRNELNITDNEASLNIDPKTGVISQWVETHEHKH